MYNNYLKQARNSEFVRHIREQCNKKGLSCYKSLAVIFRRLDSDMSKNIDRREFIRGMKMFGIVMKDDELGLVFDMCDRNRSGTIDFREFMDVLQPDLPECRLRVICEVFDRLDVTKDGVLKDDDVKIIYKEMAMNHPKVQSGQWTEREAYKSFLDTFDDPDPANRDGVVTLDEFISYYTQVSSTVDDDAYFDMMMRSCWGLKQKSAGKGHKS